MTCLAKKGTDKNPKLPAASDPQSTQAKEKFLECRCREDGALLQLAVFKMSAHSNLPSGHPLPPWKPTKTFSHPEELAYTEVILAKTSGLSVEQLLQPPAGRLISTVNWAVKELEELLDAEGNEGVAEEVKSILGRIRLPK